MLDLVIESRKASIAPGFAVKRILPFRLRRIRKTDREGIRDEIRSAGTNQKAGRPIRLVSVLEQFLLQTPRHYLHGPSFIRY